MFLVKLKMCELWPMGLNRTVRQSAESGRLRNSAVELKPKPNSIPDIKPPFLTLTQLCIYILHSTFYEKP